MGQLVETGFTTQYTVSKIRSIKVTESGDMNGMKYSSSVKLKCINVEQTEDKDLGLIEKEFIIEFKVPCDDRNLKKFNLYLRELQKANSPLVLHGTLPRDAGKDTYTVTSYLTAEEIMTTVDHSTPTPKK